MKKTLPKDWVVKPMREVVKWGAGGTPKANEIAYYKGGTIPWLIVGDLTNGIVTKSQTKITKLGLANSTAKMIPSGTLLVAMYGSIGKLGITGIECCTNQAIAFAKELNGLTTKFLFYYMQFLKPKLQSLGKGGTQSNISQTVLNSLEIVVPPIQEQQRIVDRIESLFSELDKGVETLDTIKSELAVYKDAILKKAFEGNFEERSLCEISSVINGYAFKSKMYDEMGKYTIVKIGNVKQWRFDYSRDLTRTNEADRTIIDKYLLKSGDCVISLTGSRGKRDYGFVSMVTTEKNLFLNQRVAALRFNKKVALPLFYKYYLASTYFRDQFFKYETGNVGQGNVGINALKEPKVICPKLDEQASIVYKIEQQVSCYEHIMEVINNVQKKLDHLRQSILKKAFEGEL